MDIENLYRDYNIQTASSSDKHYREGWLNCKCPFCSGHEGFHLGFHLQDEYFVCWRCGSHPQKITFSAVLGVGIRDVGAILQKYSFVLRSPRKTPKVILKPFHLPSGIEEIFPQRHRMYLEKRGFDPDKIISKWGIKATGVYSKLENINYRHRIIIPYVWGGEIVTFQGRDITGKHPLKYLACPEIREKRNIKTIVYGNSKEWGDLGIGVEGVTDVWRLGGLAVGLSGIKYKSRQVREIAKIFKRFVVIFDPEPQAQVQADKLVADLRFRGVDAFKQVLGSDPADMNQADADALIRQLKTWRVK